MPDTALRRDTVPDRIFYERLQNQIRDLAIPHLG
jgi:hypothetical protein